MEKVYYAEIEIPLGTVWAAATDRGLVQVHVSGRKEDFLTELRRRIDAEPVALPIDGLHDAAHLGLRESALVIFHHAEYFKPPCEPGVFEFE